MNNILLLCVGNICRSPIAEGLFKQQFPEKKIWSAGLGALIGNAADDMAIKVAARNSLDLSAHRAQQLVGWMCQTAELILVMEQQHKTQVEQQYPSVRGKVFRLGEVGQFEIADPYRKTQDAFEAAYFQISSGVSDWATRIKQLG